MSDTPTYDALVEEGITVTERWHKKSQSFRKTTDHRHSKFDPDSINREPITYHWLCEKLGLDPVAPGTGRRQKGE